MMTLVPCAVYEPHKDDNVHYVCLPISFSAVAVAVAAVAAVDAVVVAAVAAIAAVFTHQVLICVLYILHMPALST